MSDVSESSWHRINEAAIALRASTSSSSSVQSAWAGVNAPPSTPIIANDEPGDAESHFVPVLPLHVVLVVHNSAGGGPLSTAAAPAAASASVAKQNNVSLKKSANV